MVTFHIGNRGQCIVMVTIPNGPMAFDRYIDDMLGAKKGLLWQNFSRSGERCRKHLFWRHVTFLDGEYFIWSLCSESSVLLEKRIRCVPHWTRKTKNKADIIKILNS